MSSGPVNTEPCGQPGSNSGWILYFYHDDHVFLCAFPIYLTIVHNVCWSHRPKLL